MSTTDSSASVERNVRVLGGSNAQSQSEIATAIQQIHGVNRALRSGRGTSRLPVASGELGSLYAAINDALDAEQPRLQVLIDALDGLEKGDLTRSTSSGARGEVGRIESKLGASLDSLSDTLRRVHDSTDRIASGSAQVASASVSLSHGATRQAAAIEQIAASMDEMTSQTTRNAQNATEANRLSVQASSLATSGDAQMQAMLGAMSEIEEASRSISKIIKVIDEIAFQTNLLALNAAVEAARAGVHGRGFAVVAEEVRNLAARSAKAAKETTSLIEGTVKKVSQGMQIANDTAGALAEIVGSVDQVSELVAQIAVASSEQAEGIIQVNDGLRQVDQVTQQTTVGAEQGVAASETLSEQASSLMGILDGFRLREPIHAAEDALLSEIPPELIAAFQSFLASGAGSVDTKVKRAREERKERSVLDPRSIISLDDAEFGRY
ncbi:MAG: hypothetical protein CL927_01150 [Deltaproteobacteria bacterium]|nr:hypothetical protein [Deltaproteobacteria bacterium]HCH62674.1 hypothetical protein [Deltaproteobacteria bacterium]